MKSTDLFVVNISFRFLEMYYANRLIFVLTVMKNLIVVGCRNQQHGDLLLRSNKDLCFEQNNQSTLTQAC